MVRTKRAVILLLIIALIISTVTTTAFGQGAETSGTIDYVLVRVNESTIVRVPLIEYANAFYDESGLLYDYLKDQNSTIILYGVVSGQKYIDLIAYANLFFDYEGNVAEALENAPSIDSSVVQTFKVLVGFDDEGNAILEPVAPEVPRVDKTALAEKISEAEGLNEEQYRHDTWEALVQALEAARQVYNNEDATQEQVDEACQSLVDAMDALVIPTINATFRRVTFPPNSKFGFVITGVDGLPDAAKFSVEYYVKEKDENGDYIPVLTETDIVNIGEEAGMIYYEPGVDPYDKVNIKIYNEAEDLIWEFNNVILSIGNAAKHMLSQFEIHLTITN